MEVPPSVPSRLFLLFLFSLFLFSSQPAAAQEKWTPTHFDFIVVGAGSAGAVVASRLTEDPNVQLLLLEAGGYPPRPQTEIPYYTFRTVGSEIDWDFYNEPQETCCKGFIGGRWSWPRGKVLGGSSVLNGLVYTRGFRQDFDAWEAKGNEGWGYEDVLPYFKKLEDYQVPAHPDDAEYFGNGGPQVVSNPGFRTPLAYSFLEAGRELGYAALDVNGKHNTGFTLPVFSIKNGTRFSTYDAYLKEPEKKRKNLHVVTNALATKITFDGKRAAGIIFEHGGKLWKAEATKEVILSSSSANTPQLLMLSGVGPQDHLKSLKIPVVHHLPGVGQRVKDHVGMNGLFFHIDVPSSFGYGKYDTEENMKLWKERRLGPLTGVATNEGMAFIHSKNAKKGTAPDIEIVQLSDTLVNPTYKTNPMKTSLDPELFNESLQPEQGKEGFLLFPILQDVRSEGTITLKSNDPHDPPLIDMKYLKDPRDAELLLEGIKLSFDIANTAAYQRYGTRFYPKPLKVCSDHEFLSDEYWYCAMKYLTQGTWHQVGACEMGPETDPLAVVDSKLKVHGLQSLRVIDSSIMPTVTRGHTNSPSIMIGEKGSDFIKEEWNLASKHEHEEL